MRPDECAALVKQVQAGNSEAMTELVLAHQQEVRTFVATYAASREMIDEVHQAVWAAFRRVVVKHPPTTELGSWLRQQAAASLKLNRN